MQRRDVLKVAVSAAATSLLANTAVRANQPARIRVGQIGTRHGHAAGKLQTLRKFPELYEVVGYADPDPEQARQVSNDKAYAGLPVMTEAELLTVPGLQLVTVETDVKDLLATASKCVAAGKHIHLDKPAGESLATFKSLLDLAQERNVVVQMGYMFRYNHAFRFLMNAVREGWLGPVFEIHGVMSKQLGAEDRRDLARFAGGSMFELGCHLIDVLVTLMGKPDRITPFNRTTLPEQDSLADNQLAVFEYPKATATIRSSMLEPFGGDRRHFTVCGQEGTIEIYPLEPSRLRMALSKPRDGFKRGWQEVKLPAMTGRYDGEFEALARMIRKEQPVEWSAAHDLLVQDCVLKASGLPLEPAN